MNEIMNSIAERARQNNPPAPDDYRGNDGLLRCAKCGEKKEAIIPPCHLEGGHVIIIPASRCGWSESLVRSCFLRLAQGAFYFDSFASFMARTGRAQPPLIPKRLVTVCRLIPSSQSISAVESQPLPPVCSVSHRQ